MAGKHFNMHDIRADLSAAPLETVVSFRKASMFGHTMRQADNYLTKLALLGQFFPSIISDTAKAYTYFKSIATTAGHRNTSSYTRHTVLSNALDWLHGACGIPILLLPYLAQDRDQWKKITREQYAKEILTDMSKGHNTTEKMITDRREFLIKKYSLSPEMNTLHTTMHSSECLVCKCTMTVSLLEHVRTCHASTYHSAFTSPQYIAYKESCESWDRYRTVEILRKSKDTFYRTTGLHGSFSKKVTKKENNQYFCKICRLTYSTSIDGMAAHAQAHANQQIIRIYQKKDPQIGKAPDFWVYVPEQHLQSADGKYHPPAGSEIFKVVPPENAIRKDNRMYCRICEIYSRPMYVGNTDTLMPPSESSRNAACINGHEQGCGLRSRVVSAKLA